MDAPHKGKLKRKRWSVPGKELRKTVRVLVRTEMLRWLEKSNIGLRKWSPLTVQGKVMRERSSPGALAGEAHIGGERLPGLVGEHTGGAARGWVSEAGEGSLGVLCCAC